MQLETAQSTSTTHQYQVSGAAIFVYERGSGTPVLLLHGAPDTHDMWLPMIEHLPQTMRYIVPDLPGFGASTLPDHFSLTLDHEADFIRDLLDTMNITEPVTLVMHDFGGHYGMAFAAKYPERTRGLVISNTNFFHDYQWHSFAKLYRVPVLGELLMLGASNRAMMKRSLKQYAPELPETYIESSHAAGFGSPKTRKTMLRMYRERNPDDFRGWEDRLLAFFQHKPALILWGDRDPFITPAYADRYAGAQIHHFERYSHWLPIEAPDQYAAALAGWLQKAL